MLSKIPSNNDDFFESIISGIDESTTIPIYTDIYARKDIQSKSEKLPLSKKLKTASSSITNWSSAV